MENLNNFYASKKVKAGSIFAIYDGQEVSIAEILQVGHVERGDKIGRIYKLVCLTSAMPYGPEIEVYEDHFYPIPKKVPANRLFRSKFDVFSQEDIRFFVGTGLPEGTEIYYLGDFDWIYNTRYYLREVRLDRGLLEVEEMKKRLQAVLGEGDDS